MPNFGGPPFPSFRDSVVRKRINRDWSANISLTHSREARFAFALCNAAIATSSSGQLGSGRGTNKEDCEEKREREEAMSAIELKFTNGRRNPDMKS